MSTFSPPWGNYMLKDIVETIPPESISWWPQTIAWKVIGLAILLWVLRFVVKKVKTYQANAYRREAIAWLEGLPFYQQEEVPSEYRQLPALIKKVALIAYGRKQVNQVPSDEWEAWLDQQCPDSNFKTDHKKLLAQLAFAPEVHINPDKMQHLVLSIKQWINGHGGNHA